MRKVFLDTNVILDYFGASNQADSCRNARSVIDELWKTGDGFLVTSSQIKDVRYILERRFRRAVQIEKGTVSEADAAAAQACADAALDNLLALASVASEGASDCATARVLCRQHPDFENNLIAAVALRSQADCIVTRDAGFIRHCPVACMTPGDFLNALENGII